jgi:hypothetical protein
MRRDQHRIWAPFSPGRLNAPRLSAAATDNVAAISPPEPQLLLRGFLL